MQFKIFCVLIIVGVVHGADRWCDSQKDCNSNECCVTNNPPDGKRFLTGSGLGHCVALGQTGSGCYVRYGSASTLPTGVVFGCPCAIPLTCHGSHMIEVPLGEVGTCG